MEDLVVSCLCTLWIYESLECVGAMVAFFGSSGTHFTSVDDAPHRVSTAK